MKDWKDYLNSRFDTDLWGFICLDYYYRFGVGRPDPSEFMRQIVESVQTRTVDPVAFHRVLVSVCVQLLGGDFDAIIERSMQFLRPRLASLGEEERQKIVCHYSVYGKKDAIRGGVNAPSPVSSMPSGVGTNIAAADNALRPEDRQWMELAIEESRKSRPEDDRVHPVVGVVVVKDGKLMAKAYRGQVSGNHAEYYVLEQLLDSQIVSGATVYTTLEPCTTRKHPKVPCAERLCERKVARVVIGMLDPNTTIRGNGIIHLRRANIATELFPKDLMAIVEELNREFTRFHHDQNKPA